MTTPVEPYAESVQEAVARETARRKRVFLAFLALLLLPITIGVYALTRAPSETEKIANEVTPIVTERVDGQIADRVKSEVVSQAAPIIRDNVAREITTNVEPLRRDITELQTTARETSRLEDRLVKLAGTQERMHQEVASTRELAQGFSKEELHGIRKLANTGVQTANANKETIDALERRVSMLEAEVKKLQGRIQR